MQKQAAALALLGTVLHIKDVLCFSKMPHVNFDPMVHVLCEAHIDSLHLLDLDQNEREIFS